MATAFSHLGGTSLAYARIIASYVSTSGCRPRRTISLKMRSAESASCRSAHRSIRLLNVRVCGVTFSSSMRLYVSSACFSCPLRNSSASSASYVSWSTRRPPAFAPSIAYRARWYVASSHARMNRRSAVLPTVRCCTDVRKSSKKSVFPGSFGSSGLSTMTRDLPYANPAGAPPAACRRWAWNRAATASARFPWWFVVDDDGPAAGADSAAATP
mmetsp:Transcript_54754/g.168706  ORF Transcript_54754/g.168706 Transcript_54754/m.168706 type:complete len:214 (-) Transcript_54754:274-915(-)